MKKYFLVIDQGTTSSRIVLYNKKFEIFDIVQKEFKQYFPNEGWVEHNATEIWDDVKNLISKILKKNKLNSKNHLKNLNYFLEENIKLVNFDYNKLPKNLLKEAKRLLPKTNYIGFSITQGNEYRKKSWSIYKFIALANKSLIKNKIPVFFIEKNQEQIIEKIKDQVPNALFPELKSKLSCPALVTALAARLDQAITIDNGVMHMIGLANIPMIVLFGPTSSEKFAPKNDFIKILDSKVMHKTSNIESISVDEVYNLI